MRGAGSGRGSVRPRRAAHHAARRQQEEEEAQAAVSDALRALPRAAGFEPRHMQAAWRELGRAAPHLPPALVAQLRRQALAVMKACVEGAPSVAGASSPGADADAASEGGCGLSGAWVVRQALAPALQRLRDLQQQRQRQRQQQRRTGAATGAMGTGTGAHPPPSQGRWERW